MGEAEVAQSARRPTSARVMIVRLVGSSPASGSLLAVQSPLGILSLSPSLSAPPLLARSGVPALPLKTKILKVLTKESSQVMCVKYFVLLSKDRLLLLMTNILF